jgi:HSP20 family protein
VELSEFDPYRAIGGHTPFSKFMIRQRREVNDAWQPVLEGFHTADEMILRYEIAGVAPEDIDVRVDGRVLYVQGVRRRTEIPPDELTVLDERVYGPFRRGIVLPEGTDPAAVRASYQYGVLEIRVAHNRRPEPRVVSPDVSDSEPIDVPIR